MPEIIESSDVVPSNGVPGAYIPGKLDVVLERLPDILKILFAVSIIGVVSYVCITILFSGDTEIKQFKQAAFTLLASFATGAGGFMFGVASSKG